MSEINISNMSKSTSKEGIKKLIESSEKDKESKGKGSELYSLGMKHFEGKDGYVKDYKKAKDFFEEASLNESSDAKNALGYMYENGLGVNIDGEQARNFYTEAAEMGNMTAQYNLGVMYFEGIAKVKKNYDLAIVWFEKAAEQGCLDAKEQLGSVYYLGENGVEKNYEKGFRYTREAAMGGSLNSQNNLGLMYCNGDGTEKNVEKGISLLKSAAEQGVVDAQYNLGLFYYRGDMVPKHSIDSYVWANIAAASGKKDAIKLRDFLATELSKSMGWFSNENTMLEKARDLCHEKFWEINQRIEKKKEKNCKDDFSISM